MEVGDVERPGLDIEPPLPPSILARRLSRPPAERPREAGLLGEPQIDRDGLERRIGRDESPARPAASRTSSTSFL